MFREVREIIRMVGPNRKAVNRGKGPGADDEHSKAAIPSTPFHLLDLPPEVRVRVYEQLFAKAWITIHGGERAKVVVNDSFNLQVLQTSRSVRAEALPILMASTTLHLLDKRPQDLSSPIPDTYLSGIRSIYLLPRLHARLSVPDFPSLQLLSIFMSREELFAQPKPSAESYEDPEIYSDADLIADARTGLLRSGRSPAWLVGEIEKPRAQRGYTILVCCTIYHKKGGNHLDLEIKLDGVNQDKVVRKVHTWTSSTENDDGFM